MRLINTHTLELDNFANNDLVPPYAILSHTWDEGEVTFQDWHDHETRAKRKGFAKIRSTCRQAALDGYTHAWVDTNCIDKSSSAELSEAINSMFDWYQNASVCYVYMADVPASTAIDECCKPDSQFRKSRWFTRGWTLQELIAPRVTEFYAKDWSKLGTKRDLIGVISEVTGVDHPCLLGQLPPTEFSIAQVMSWASARVTTRPEDQAYCLLGLFGVNMPLLYGEGRKAFLRLQEEIIKSSDDQSIFVCDMESLAMKAPLATSPALFSGSGGVGRWSLMAAPMATIPPFYSMTNAGLSITLPLIQTLSPRFVLGVLNCNLWQSQGSGTICLPLSSHVSNYRHQYTRIALPSPWIAMASTSIRRLLPAHEESAKYPENWSPDFIPEESTNIMITMPPKSEVEYLSRRIFGPVKRMGANVFFFITFPRGLSGHRVYAADPPEALEERTSMMAMVGQGGVDDLGRGLLVFKERGSGRGAGRYIAVYLEAALRHDGAAEDWPRACRIIPDWRTNDSLDHVMQNPEQCPLGRASWVGDVLVTIRTTVPIRSVHAPDTSIVLLAEIVFDMGRYRESRGRKGSVTGSNDSYQYSLMLRDSDESGQD